jgi:hypothetical protein
MQAGDGVHQDASLATTDQLFAWMLPHEISSVEMPLLVVRPVSEIEAAVAELWDRNTLACMVVAS